MNKDKAKELHLHPLNLKTKIWNQGEEDWVQENYLDDCREKRRIKGV